MGLVTFLILIGATWRLAYAVATEEGPGELFATLRRWAQQGPRWLSQGMHCIKCVSFWIGPALGLVLLPTAEGLLAGLAASAVCVVLIDKVYR